MQGLLTHFTALLFYYMYSFSMYIRKFIIFMQKVIKHDVIGSKAP